VRGSKTEYDKFKDADASYQDRESYKIVVEPMSSVYVHECPPESPAQGKIGSSWLTEGNSASRFTAGALGFFDLIQSGERPERSVSPSVSRRCVQGPFCRRARSGPI
jgi:hypothetical protein